MRSIPRSLYPYHFQGSDVEKFKALVEAGGGDTEVRLGDWYGLLGGELRQGRPLTLPVLCRRCPRRQQAGQ